MAVAMRDLIDALSTGWRKRAGISGSRWAIAQGYATIGAIGFEGRMTTAAIATSRTSPAGCARGRGRPESERGSGRVSG